MEIINRNGKMCITSVYYNIGARVHVREVADKDFNLRDIIDNGRLIPVYAEDYILELTREFGAYKEDPEIYKAIIFKTSGEIYKGLHDEPRLEHYIVAYSVGEVEKIKEELKLFSEMIDRALDRIAEFF